MECKQCGLCCGYVTIHIDKPTSKTDWDNLFWYLHHENVFVYLDDENDWFVEFKTKCKNLNPKKECKVYKDRPNICRGHDSKDCEATGNAYNVVFRDVKSLKRYLSKKKIDYKFKKN